MKCLRFSFSNRVSNMAEALCKYGEHPFKGSHLRYLNIRDSKSYCLLFRFESNTVCGSASWEKLPGKLAEPRVCLGEEVTPLLFVSGCTPHS